MAKFQELPYTTLQDRFRALTGLESLSTTDSGFLRDLVNRRIRLAYERYPWPSFTIVGEEITIGSDNAIATYFDSNTQGTKLANQANVVFRIHKDNPLTTRYPDEHTFLQDINALGEPVVKIITPGNLDNEKVYVTYRKDLKDLVNADGASTGYYGDESGDNSEIPWIFFEYAVHGSYADFLRGDGQNQKAIAEDQYAESLLVHEIDKVSNQGRQFRHDILQYRPPSQFNRHNVQVGGTPIGVSTSKLANNVQ